jgi:hypothetical protein
LTIAEQKEKHLTLRKETVALDAKRERICRARLCARHRLRESAPACSKHYLLLMCIRFLTTASKEPCEDTVLAALVKTSFSSLAGLVAKVCTENALETLQQLCITLLRDIVNPQYLRISISIC